jgi:two-component system, NtrC family, nitrogen regulation sensor histidine kinase GlnL
MHAAKLSPNPYDGLQTAIFELNHAAQVIGLNAAAQAMLGSTQIHAANQSLSAWFVMDETLEKLNAHLIEQQNEVCRGILNLARVPDEWRDSGAVHVVLTPDTTGSYLLECYQLGAYEHVHQDAQWRAQVKNHQMLMRQMAHEIKNPLGGIRGAAQLLHHELAEVQPELMEYTEMMLAQVDRLKNLVDQFLVPYRQGLTQAKTVNIHEVCEAVSQLARIEFGTRIVLVRDYDVSVPSITGVADYLQQLLLNLVQNAAQAVQHLPANRGKVTLRTRVARQCVINHQMRAMVLEVCVIDNGAGVPPEIYDTLFLPMVTQREGGTGLGLSVAMQIAQQHGGNIEVHSRAGHTQMRVLLPLSAENDLTV